MVTGSTPDRDERISAKFGERAECDICEEEDLCIERYGMVTCQPCYRLFMPSGGLL